MELAHPMRVVTNSLDGEVLSVLGRAQAEFTVADVQRLLGGRSDRGLRMSLERLAAEGVVTVRKAGRTSTYALNDSHLAAPFIRGLADLRSLLIKRLEDELATWSQPPVYGALFGSGTRSDHTRGSDIDVFLVRPDAADPATWDEQVDTLSRRVTAWTGNDTRVLEMRARDVSGRSAVEPILASIADEGVTLIGDRSWLARKIRSGATETTRGLA